MLSSLESEGLRCSAERIGGTLVAAAAPSEKARFKRRASVAVLLLLRLLRAVEPRDGPSRSAEGAVAAVDAPVLPVIAVLLRPVAATGTTLGSAVVVDWGSGGRGGGGGGAPLDDDCFGRGGRGGMGGVGFTAASHAPATAPPGTILPVLFPRDKGTEVGIGGLFGVRTVVL